jgi:uncharacterized cupin superfamily protein
MNNTLDDVRLLVIGERSKPENRIHYPLNPDYEQSIADSWKDPPLRSQGPNNGKSSRADTCEHRNQHHLMLGGHAPLRPG